MRERGKQSLDTPAKAQRAACIMQRNLVLPAAAMLLHVDHNSSTHHRRVRGLGSPSARLVTAAATAAASAMATTVTAPISLAAGRLMTRGPATAILASVVVVILRIVVVIV